ncbi:MAG: SIMPL domain-containing protein [Pseudarthrobacter sp.]
MKPQHFGLAAGFLLLTSILLVVVGRPAAQPKAPEPERRITVVGEGEFRAKPNLARITFGVLTSGASAAEAEASNFTLTAQVRTAMVGTGVEEETLELIQPILTATPVQDYTGLVRITGFQARSRITGTVRNLGRIQNVIDSALSFGATSVEEVTFLLDSPETSKQQAIYRALENARSRASALLTRDGQTLGELLTVEVLAEPVIEGSDSAGSLTFRARVRATFEY